MVPGGGAMYLNDSIGSRKDIQYVGNLHEQASAMAAEAYAKMTGSIGVSIVTTGPGGTNAITGLAGAWLDSTPVMIISGQVKRSDLKGRSGVRQKGIQEIDIVSIVSPITKYAKMIMKPQSIRYEMEKAMVCALSGRPGPVWLDIPLDVQSCQIKPKTLKGFKPLQKKNKSKASLRKKIAKTIKLLKESSRPVFLLGNGLRLSNGIPEFKKVQQNVNIPVLTTWLAADIIPENNIFFVGRPGSVAPRAANFAIQNSDLLISIGARIDHTITGYAPERLAREAKKIIIDIDPAELKKFEKHSEIRMCCDAREFLKEFLKQVIKKPTGKKTFWLRKCHEWKKRYPVVLEKHRNPNQLVSTYFLSEILSQQLEENSLVVPGSSGAGIEIFQLAFKIKKGQRLFQTSALGSMGNGVPASIGVCLGSNRQNTICIDGDGGFQFNIQELETIRRLKLPIKIFVLNNSGYSSIRTSQNRWFKKLTCADSSSGLTLPDICKVASAYKLKTFKIYNQNNLEAEIKAVLKHRGPLVCEVVCIPDEPRIPSLSSAQRKDGSLFSKPLEDLWPFLDRKEFIENMIIPVLKDN